MGLKERYEALQEEYRLLEEEVRQDKARLEIKREELKKSQKDLKDTYGVDFKSSKELLQIKKDVEKRLDEQLTRMEDLLGLGEDDDGEDFDFEL